MARTYSISGVDYHLLKRNRKHGKPVYYVGFLSDLVGANGRRRYKAVRSTGTGNTALARKIALQMIEKGDVFAATDELRGFLLTFWNPEKSEYLRGKAAEGHPVSTAYARNSRSLVERYVLPYFEKRGVMRLSDLTRPLILSWRNDLFENRSAEKGGRLITPRTINTARQSLTVPIRWAVTMGLLPYDPSATIKPVHGKPAERQIFQLDEYEKLFSVEWVDLRYKTACLLASVTGMRMGEVRGLLVKNLHLDDGYLDVLTSWQDTEGLKPPKWDSERLGVELPANVVEAIREVLAVHRWGAEPDHFVFFGTESAAVPMGKQALERALRNAMKAAKLPSGRLFHSLRHSLVSHAASTLSPAALMGFIGHRQEETTEGYQHVTDRDREAMREIQAKILPFKKAQ
jgi:integrase